MFLIYFSIIENMSNRIIETENPISEGEFNKFQFRKNFERLNNLLKIGIVKIFTEKLTTNIKVKQEV